MDFSFSTLGDPARERTRRVCAPTNAIEDTLAPIFSEHMAEDLIAAGIDLRDEKGVVDYLLNTRKYSAGAIGRCLDDALAMATRQ